MLATRLLGKVGLRRWVSNPLPRYPQTATETTTRESDILPGLRRDNGNSDMTVSDVSDVRMTPGSQTHTGAAGLRQSLMNPKEFVNVGFWNVRTMFQTSKAAQVAKEFREYRLNILGISECRWEGYGKIKLTTGETILYSGKEEGHESGVAMMLDSLAEKCLLDWEPVSDRIIRARFDSRYAKMTIVQCYAPTNNAEEEVKERFYEQLQGVISKVGEHEVLIVGGDLNAKVGADDRRREMCMGKFGMGEMNENGLLFSDFCMENSLVIGGTHFQHRDVHKYTWESPDGRTRNQIDHVTINRKWMASLKDVRTRRGADVNSDHVLVVARLKLSLRGVKRTVDRRKLSVEKLKENGVKEQFYTKIYNRFEVLQDRDVEDVEEFWKEYRDALKETAEEVIGYKKGKREEWISEDSWEKMKERKELRKRVNEHEDQPQLKENLMEEYKEKEKEVKRSVREDKRRFVEKKAMEAESAARVGDSRTLFQISKTLGKKSSGGATGPVKDKDGTVLTTEKEQQERWAEHFRGVLNRASPTEVPVIEPGEELEIGTGVFSEAEVKVAVEMMKNNKAAGSDGIPAEIYKVGLDENVKILQKLFERIWSDEKVPTEWLKGNIAKIPKKGDKTVCDNWRGVTLLNVASKIFTRCIFQRISGAVDDVLRENQAGFRKGRACIDQIYVLRKMIEESVEHQKGLSINFIDFEKAFDSVYRPALWDILRHYGIPEKMVKLIRVMYEGFECAVVHEGKLSPYFAIETGVKQGCLLSGLLFLLVIDWLMKNTVSGVSTGVKWTDDETLEDLGYADDIALVSEKFEDLQQKTTRLNQVAKGVGLKINCKKSEILRVNALEEGKIRIEETELKEVERFIYLGSYLSKTGGSEEDMQNRITKAQFAFRSLNNIWKSSVYSTNTKLKLFGAIVKSTLMYGSECWTVTKKAEKKLRVFQQKCLRRILRVFYPNLVRNEEILRRTEQIDIIEEQTDRKWRWIGHMARKHPGHITKQAFEWKLGGKRRRGRPRQTWMRVTEEECVKTLQMTLQQAMEKAGDRVEWRRMVVAVRACKALRA